VFTELSWFFVMEGMGLRPRSYDPLADASNWAQVRQVMTSLQQKTTAEVAAAPLHDSFFPDKPRDTTPAPGWKTAARHAS
jgi:tryptophan halogenase